MVVVGGSKGIRSAISLIASGVFIASILIPMYLKGYNPVWASLLIATINSVLTFMLVGGMTRKSLAGVLGTPPPRAVESAPRRRTRGNKRCRNERLLASGYAFRYPTFREGYTAVLAGAD